MPGKKATGAKMAKSTRVVEMMGPVTCSMAFKVASRRARPSSSMRRCTFSTTTMASSTTRPMAKTTAKRLMVLAEKPAASRTAKTPIRDTGMVRAGTMVARKSCRKRYTTSSTITAVMARVEIISVMEAWTKRVESYMTSASTPSGNRDLSCSSWARTSVATCRALAPGA